MPRPKYPSTLLPRMNQLGFTDYNAAFGPTAGLNNPSADLFQNHFGLWTRNQMAKTDLSNNSLSISREIPLDTEAMDASRVVEKFQRFKTSATFLRDCERELREKKDKLNSETTGENSIEAKMDKTIQFLLGGFQASQEDYEKLIRAKQDFLEIERKIAGDLQGILDRQLHDTRLELEYAESNLLTLRKFIEMGVRNMIPEERVRSNLCPVCMEHEVNRCIVPCGHTCCSSCAGNIGTNCMSCRGHIQSVNPLFFSI